MYCKYNTLDQDCYSYAHEVCHMYEVYQSDDMRTCSHVRPCSKCAHACITRAHVSARSSTDTYRMHQYVLVWYTYDILSKHDKYRYINYLWWDRWKRDVAKKSLNFKYMIPGTRHKISVPLAMSTIFKTKVPNFKNKTKKLVLGQMLGQDRPEKNSTKC